MGSQQTADSLARIVERRAEPQFAELVRSADREFGRAGFDGHEAGWFDGVRRNVRMHPGEASAVADFIHRLAAWLARRHVIETGD